MNKRGWLETNGTPWNGVKGTNADAPGRRSSSVSAPGSERSDVPGEDGEDVRLSVSSGREEQDRLLGDDGGIRGNAFSCSSSGRSERER